MLKKREYIYSSFPSEIYIYITVNIAKPTGRRSTFSNRSMRVIDMDDAEQEISIIQQTDVDAKLAKRSAAALGYLDDPFIAEFVKTLERKSPIINRGSTSSMYKTKST